MSNLISVMRPEMNLCSAIDKITALSSKSEFLDLIILKVVIYFSRECRPISLVDGFAKPFLAILGVFKSPSPLLVLVKQFEYR